jgi:YD repeat-containing protein
MGRAILLGAFLAVGLVAHVVLPPAMTLSVGGPPGLITLSNSDNETDCTTTANIRVSSDVVSVRPMGATYSTPPQTSTFFTVTAERPGSAVVTVAWTAGTSPTCRGSCTDGPACQVAVTVLPGQPGMPPSTFFNIPGAGVVGDPIASATGELYQTETDLALGGPLPLIFRRHYASLLKANGVTSALGNNWMHNFEAKLAVSGTNATVTLFGGQTVAFRQSGGNWALAGPERTNYQLVAAGSDVRFLHPLEDRIYTFSAAGVLTRVEDRNGNALTVTPGPNGPTSVSDGLGRTLTFAYTGNKLTAVADSTGRSISFSHTGDDLTGFTDPEGKRTTYSYTTAGGSVGLLVNATLPGGNRPFTQASTIWPASYARQTAAAMPPQ